jgi:hypothetical protein
VVYLDLLWPSSLHPKFYRQKASTLCYSESNRKYPNDPSKKTNQGGSILRWEIPNMTRHFLRYWISHDGDWSILAQPFMTYSASNQYDRVSYGDVLWAVIRDKTNHHLVLVGRMTVDWIGDKDDASMRLSMIKDDLFDAEIYVTCDEPEPYDYIDINSYAVDLRFISNTNDRLNLVNGLVSPQQLQTMRELTTQSAQLMQDIWYDVNQSVFPATSNTFSEGEPRIRVHVQRERNQTLVSVAKHHFKEAHGRLFCEVCEFDFSDRYGELGDDFIEAHHRVPLSESNAEVETSVDDLAMVCANCHRMLHRQKPWLSVEEPRKRLRRNLKA